MSLDRANPLGQESTSWDDLIQLRTVKELFLHFGNYIYVQHSSGGGVFRGVLSQTPSGGVVIRDMWFVGSCEREFDASDIPISPSSYSRTMDLPTDITDDYVQNHFRVKTLPGDDNSSSNEVSLAA